MDFYCKTLYAVPTYKCNLNCLHCDVKNQIFDENEEKFLSTLNNVQCEEIILFGGEPLLNKDKVIKYIKTNKISSISSNLLLIDDEIIDLCYNYNITIGTSWNVNRFSSNQYDLWLSNIKKFNKYKDFKILVLITMTEDLLDFPIHKVLIDLENTEAIDGILFEPLLSSSKELIEKFDNWLSLLSKNWNYSMKNFIEKRILNWYNKCDGVFTLNPNGKLQPGCTHKENINIIKKECLKCENSDKCMPCVKQSNCTFYPKFYEEIKKKNAY